ncbi:hypothetical protein C8F04DRAFT_1181440 [Mycena alexandri]|uniref:Uncharacterized protein n=1 Tax=Mycena alexandri TaxID=1745969 RepID=A0AAD6X4I9_9AGAR|nr:hypothetical protein C8F04DRAFT_1181440 [Mycena alexandri]
MPGAPAVTSNTRQNQNIASRHAPDQQKNEGRPEDAKQTSCHAYRRRPDRGRRRAYHKSRKYHERKSGSSWGWCEQRMRMQTPIAKVVTRTTTSKAQVKNAHPSQKKQVGQRGNTGRAQAPGYAQRTSGKNRKPERKNATGAARRAQVGVIAAKISGNKLDEISWKYTSSLTKKVPTGQCSRLRAIYLYTAKLLTRDYHMNRSAEDQLLQSLVPAGTIWLPAGMTFHGVHVFLASTEHIFLTKLALFMMAP